MQCPKKLDAFWEQYIDHIPLFVLISGHPNTLIIILPFFLRKYLFKYPMSGIDKALIFREFRLIFLTKKTAMPLEKKVQELIEKINSGKLKEHLDSLNGSDYGLYIPVYVDGNTVKPMLEGYSQTEKDLVVSVGKKEDDVLNDAKPVAWFGNKNGKDSKCDHGKTATCRHCTGHEAKCRHCTHQKGKIGEAFKAPKLDYDSVIKELDDKKDILNNLAKEDFGLTLLHGHSDEHMFTKLPEGYVSVITDGVTSFEKEDEIINNQSFVPNMWRSINGKLKIAGGYLLS
ncbi:hypothetical protein [Pedobacter punctiformis]|uniref:Uncharacterized protein n=1 Tax=Pedobacter punctiformis TaxID=3004097 RepID=A0ABT4L7C5_9SPHI|nr:hypothetical protein [Pedobacter sp. HCMS5-2]MCZ4243815.1 hypothetical protein [Pedobacter sp. HCMS5-2]